MAFCRGRKQDILMKLTSEKYRELEDDSSGIEDSAFPSDIFFSRWLGQDVNFPFFFMDGLYVMLASCSL